jgi:hypothetical protein
MSSKIIQKAVDLKCCTSELFTVLRIASLMLRAAAKYCRIQRA